VRLTSFDVARAAGVSQPTVSRALRDDPSISSATRALVHAVATELGYVPSERGRSLSTNATRRVAMVVDLDNPLWSLLVRQLHQELDAAGYRLTLVAGASETPGLEQQLLGGGVDGVILSTVPVDSSLPERIAEHELPLVLLNRTTERFAGDAAVADDVGGGELAAELLLEAGHRHIGAIFGPPDTSTGAGRERGFRQALAAAGAELPDALVRHGRFDFVSGQTCLLDMLDAPRPPRAIFCANDVVALGAYDAACRRGLSVPGDIALVGFDDLETAAWARFELSTVAVPFADMVRTAVRLLLRRIGGHGGPGEPTVHPVRIVPRRSHLRVEPLA
jgi:LacI family transcriptional regulator